MSHDAAIWQGLCKELEEKRLVAFSIFRVINPKFTSRLNPIEDELSESESAWNALEDVWRRMDEFINARFRKQM